MLWLSFLPRFLRCPEFTNLPSTCRVTKKAGEVCDVISCPTGTFVSSSPNLVTLGNGGNIHSGPDGSYVPPTLPTGGEAPPGTWRPVRKSTNTR